MKASDRVKLYNRIFKYSFFILLVTFLTLYLSQATGYYEYEQHKKVVFTSEQIKKFEQDVADGKNVNIENYLENTNKDYQNRISNLGLSLSEGIGDCLKKGIEGAFSFINKMIEG